jgi:ankyrin repeat protein
MTQIDQETQEKHDLRTAFSKVAGSSRKMNLAYQVFAFSRHEDFMTATSLQITARLGFFVFVKDILDGGADINAQGGEYGHALQAAASKGNEAVVRLLVDSGADVNAQGGRYGNALQAAA